MARFRLWLHEKIFTRLDGDRERRFVAKSLLVLSLVLLIAPSLLRVQAGTTATVTIVFPSPQSILQDPIIFKATADPTIYTKGVLFRVFLPNDTSASVADLPASFNQASGAWMTAAWNGNPGTAYVVTAIGTRLDGTGVAAVNPTPFTITPSDVVNAPPQQNLCGNGRCDTGSGETPDSCPADCPVLSPSPGVAGPSCGDGKCDTGETHDSCPADCPLQQTPNASLCGNSVCDTGSGETHDSCPNDCPLQTQIPTLTLDPPSLNQTATDRVNLRAAPSGGAILNVHFLVSALNFNASPAAMTANDGSFFVVGAGPLPRGATYTIVATGFSVLGAPVTSTPQVIAIPPAQTTDTTQSSTSSSTPNPLPLAVVLLSPRTTSDGQPPSFSGPVGMYAEVSNGPAEHVNFKIKNSATGAELIGVGTFDAASGKWKFFFETTVAGHYEVSVGATAGARVAASGHAPSDNGADDRSVAGNPEGLRRRRHPAREVFRMAEAQEPSRRARDACHDSDIGTSPSARTTEAGRSGRRARAAAGERLVFDDARPAAGNPQRLRPGRHPEGAVR